MYVGEQLEMHLPFLYSGATEEEDIWRQHAVCM